MLQFEGVSPRFHDERVEKKVTKRPNRPRKQHTSDLNNGATFPKDLYTSTTEMTPGTRLTAKLDPLLDDSSMAAEFDLLIGLPKAAKLFCLVFNKVTTKD